jgi:hypothetical protein
MPLNHATPDGAAVDALVVPAARPARRTREHVRLAERLGCTLVVICSKSITARAVIEQAGDPATPVVAIDFERDACPPGPDAFGSTELVFDTPFWHATDVSAKRNAALLLAHWAGWGRIFFLDDDIHIENPDDICAASALLGDYAVTGLTVHGFPDSSVAGHASRYFGDTPKHFLGSGVLMVAPKRRKTFFPEIYNDDWLYLIDDTGFPPLALTGKAIQDPYRPFDDPARAARQEFGEVIAQGLLAGTRNGTAPGQADRDFWRAFLANKRRYLDALLYSWNERIDHDMDGARIVAALQSARDTSAMITPAFCVAYVDAWLRDRQWWRSYLDTRSRSTALTDAITRLGLPALLLHPGPASTNRQDQP